MHALENGILLIVVVAAGTVAARRLRMEPSILLVLVGVALSMVPGVPRFHLDPQVVLVLILPPLLYAAASRTSVPAFRANLRPILLLAVGLTLFSTVVVGLVAHAVVPGLPLAAALALGAILAPPDAVAATAIARRTGLSRHLVTVLEGESLLNDATALVAYRVAVAAVVSGIFSPLEMTWRFALASVGGAAVGLAVGLLVGWLRRHIDDPMIDNTLSLVAPFAAYLPAERLGFSGVLACVTAGLMLGRAGPRVLTSRSRVLGTSVWEMVVFLINAFVFVLIGLQLPLVIGETGRSLGEYIVIGAAVALTVVVVRIGWIFLSTYLTAWLARHSPGHKQPNWQNVTVLSWAGMRGSVSLAAALALPTSPPFPGRSLILFSAFMVILATLVAQGLTLPALVRRLGVTADLELGIEESHARQIATEAALARIAGLRGEWPDHIPLVDQLRQRYEHRSEHVSADPTDEAADQELLEHQLIRHEVIEAERLAVIHLRDVGEISDDVLHRLERELDLEELRMEA